MDRIHSGNKLTTLKFQTQESNQRKIQTIWWMILMGHKFRMVPRMWVIKTKTQVHQARARLQNLRKRKQPLGNIDMRDLRVIKESRIKNRQRLFQKFKLLRSKRLWWVEPKIWLKTWFSNRTPKSLSTLNLSLIKSEIWPKK